MELGYVENLVIEVHEMRRPMLGLVANVSN